MDFAFNRYLMDFAFNGFYVEFIKNKTLKLVSVFCYFKIISRLSLK